jgi:ectoine hydroxylase
MLGRTDLYPSRKRGETKLLDRQDPVTYADQVAGAPIAPKQIESYEANGYLCLDKLFDKSELDLLVAERDALRKDHSTSNSESVIVEPRSKAVRSIFEVHKISEVFRRLAHDSRLVDVASYLLGDKVYVHQSRLNYKPGFFGKEFYWHSDFETWHVEDGMPRMRALSVSISLTDNLAINGPLMLIPRSHCQFVSCAGETPENHYRESLRRQVYGVPDPGMLRNLVDKGGIDAALGAAGSTTFFDCNTMHGSNSNISPFARSNVFIVYNSVENRVGEPFGPSSPRPAFLAERADFSPIEAVSGRLR